MTVLPPGAIARPAPAAPPSGGGGGFRAHLDAGSTDAATQAGHPVPAPAAGGATPALAPAPTGPPAPVREGHLTVAPAAGDAPGPAARAGSAFLERALESQRHLDAAVAEAARGRTFSAAELLGMQARLYRATETVQLFSKTVEQTSAAVKQTLRTQV